MARFSKNELKQKQLHAKDLFVKGFDYDTIAEILDLSTATVKNWGRREDFENARKTRIISLSEMRNTVLQSFSDLKDGKKPAIKPDEAAKYASAFEKLSSKKKTLSYIFEAFELLTEELLLDVQNAIKPTDRELSLTILKSTRSASDRVITKLSTEADNE